MKGIILVSLLLPILSHAQYGKFDSGWVNLYDGTFDNMTLYFRGEGFIPKTDNLNQTKHVGKEVYVPNGDIISVDGNNGLIAPDSNYSYYWVRVKYQWGPNASNGWNAGLMTHVNLASTRTSDNRPRSVELNMRRDDPGSVWMASRLGPFGTSFVNGSNEFTPQLEGGSEKLLDPTGDRMMHNYKHWGHTEIEVDNSDRSAWNQYEAKVYGADSIIIIINNEVRAKVFDLKDLVNGNPGPARISGGIGLQSEGAEIHYKEFELIGIDSITRLPLVPGCTDSTYEEYAEYQNDFPANMYTLFSNPSKCLTPISQSIRGRGKHGIPISQMKLIYFTGQLLEFSKPSYSPSNNRLKIFQISGGEVKTIDLVYFNQEIKLDLDLDLENGLYLFHWSRKE